MLLDKLYFRILLQLLNHLFFRINTLCLQAKRYGYNILKDGEEIIRDIFGQKKRHLSYLIANYILSYPFSTL